MQRKIILFAAGFAAIAVALGAMGAHALQSYVERGMLTSKNLESFDTAVRYQMFHSLALLGLSALTDKYGNQTLIKAAVILFITGIVLFSGSIYLLSLRSILGIENIRWLGPITPMGGISFIAGWCCLFGLGLKK